MKKLLTVFFVAMFCLTSLSACKDDKPEDNNQNNVIEPGKELEDGILPPEGWPEDVPTPMTGEFIWGDWTPDNSFYTVDIIYTQEDIDDYVQRLETAGFYKLETDKYKDIYGDAAVYANDRWEIVVGEEGANGDYTYISIYPVLEGGLG
ncbi:MAG: hypothetical protein ACOX1F_02690 [Erysipelotrichaceae bacterium]|jgi:hypothetical protein